MTLAYVFWHWPNELVDREEYEALVRSFDQRLSERPPAGYLRTVTFRLASGAPWTSGPAYEDWHELTGSAALDALNDAAVGPDSRTAHDAVAARAADGAGGLFALRFGALELERACAAYRFAKPAGMGYDELDDRVGRFVDARAVALWQRRMVLGPAPEFCLLVSTPLFPPAELAALALPLERVWPDP